MTTKPKYPIGTQFMTRGKYPRLCTVVDVWTTYANGGQVVKVRYVATHTLNGQVVTDTDVVETSIDMGKIP